MMGVLDLRASAPLQAELLALRGQDLRLDASGVRQLGGQCLQVLLAATSCWQADGQAFAVAAPSAAFVAALALFGAALPIVEGVGP